MLLSDYLSRARLTLAEFGKLVGGVEESTVARWRDGVMFPSPDKIEAIESATGGKVKHSDHMAARKAANGSRSNA